MVKKSLNDLIETTLLISPEMKEHLRATADTCSDEQQADMEKAILEAEAELKGILAKAMEEDGDKLAHIQQALDDVWKTYLQDVEGISETIETQKEDTLLEDLSKT